jgi:glycolate oxidase FAD binding subunit
MGHAGLPEHLGQELSKAAATRDAGTDDAVADVPAAVVAAPTSADEVAEVLRVADGNDLAVVARGAGTTLGWGMPPDRLDVVLDMTGVTGVVEHAAGDLVVVVRAGTAMSELQAVVAEAGQQLALDSPYPDATVGGMLAVSTSGPRRLLYGTARDLLIGVTFVRADGVVAKAGGKVVKNVAGYDFGKLLTGSYGTLGVITEAVFRLHPLPAARRVVTATFGDAVAAGRAALDVLGSQVVPTAVELAGPRDAVHVTVLVEGVEAGVDARCDTVVALLGHGAATHDEPPPGFGALPFATGGTGLKVTSSLTGVGPTLASAHRLADERGLEVRVGGSAAGVLHAGLAADADPAAIAAVVEGLRAATTAYDGTVTVLTAPAAVRAAVDAWGPVPGIDLMRSLKAELDPRRRLSPGRLVGGI